MKRQTAVEIQVNDVFVETDSRGNKTPIFWAKHTRSTGDNIIVGWGATGYDPDNGPAHETLYDLNEDMSWAEVVPCLDFIFSGNSFS